MDVLHVGLLLLVGLPLGYLAVLSVLAILARRPHQNAPSRFRRMAVVIPAHNEEEGIGETVQSLLSVDYPRNEFDVVVIADNCTDRTASRARSEGALVRERTSADRRSKGHALRWAFDALLTEGYEGFLVCDADTVASRNILRSINIRLERGALAVQCNDQVRPAPGAWSAEATRAGFLLYNYVRPLGRSVFGGSAGLRGNGMAFAADTLRRVPWEAYSRAEDLEYGLTLLCQGITVEFAPEASVLAIMPTDPRNAESQRARWEGGRFPVVRRFFGRLIREAVRKRSYRLLDAAIDLVTPPFVNLMLVGTGCAAVVTGLWFAGVDAMGRFALLWGIVISFGIIHVVVGFAAARALPDLVRLLRFVPIYALWKLRLYIRIIVGGDTSAWVRTVRESPSRTEGS